MDETILTIRIQSLEDSMDAALAAMANDRPEATPGYNFPTYEAMHSTLSPNRLEIIRAMAGQGALSFREVARRVNRDYKGVHNDLTALILVGFIDRHKDGVIFPYETIHFEFDIAAKAA
jgi:predicted transcriptional regulator